MRDIPVVLSGYKLTVVEPPAPKTRDDGNGGQIAVVDRQGVTQFVVSLFAKLRVQPGERAPKGEEIKVTLATDPGEGFGEVTRVELVDALLNGHDRLATQMAENLRVIATARSVTEDLLTDVAKAMSAKARPKTYGATGELAGQPPQIASGVSINRAL